MEMAFGVELMSLRSGSAGTRNLSNLWDRGGGRAQVLSLTLNPATNVRG